ncbi:MAG: hypothetical protein WCP29_07235 [Acidobacteriota bacterium]
MTFAQPITTTIVKVVPPPSPQVGVLDVLVGSLGLTGVIVLGSLVLGGALGAILIAYSRWRDAKSGGIDDSRQTRLDLSSPDR